jgi:hypothetical protein
MYVEDYTVPQLRRSQSKSSTWFENYQTYILKVKKALNTINFPRLLEVLRINVLPTWLSKMRPVDWTTGIRFLAGASRLVFPILTDVYRGFTHSLQANAGRVP